MHILRIEHEVADYDAWKQMFDNDPLGRRANGVKGHRVLRPSGTNQVLIDLEFDDAGAAEAFAAKLRDLWTRVDVMQNPTARVVEVVENEQY